MKNNMSKFKNKIHSNLRVYRLEKAFIKSIKDFVEIHEDLTALEVNSVLIKMLSDWNAKELKNETNG